MHGTKSHQSTICHMWIGKQENNLLSLKVYQVELFANYNSTFEEILSQRTALRKNILYLLIQLF